MKQLLKRHYHVYVSEPNFVRMCSCNLNDMSPARMAGAKPNLSFYGLCLNCHGIITYTRNDAYNRHWKFSGYDEDGRDE